jgi:GNAT superfamily N-acetyltransferase
MTGADRGDPADILVKLYDLPTPDLSRLVATGVAIRRPLAAEKHLLAAWIEEHFSRGWVGEAERALANRPVTCFVALRRQELIGFACWDAAALGVWGPTGVQASARGAGVGSALLLVTLQAMREQGYAYAVIGAAGPVEFYQRAVGGIVIPGSWPGLYRGMLGWPAADESVGESPKESSKE